MKSTVLALAALCSAALVAAVPPTVQKRNPPSCPSSHFFYPTKSCCLPNGGPSSYDQCPSDRSCPSDWYWHNEYNSCVPQHNPGTSNPQPDCGNGKFSRWDRNDQCCKAPPTTTPTTPTTPSNPSCPGNYFYWPARSGCLPNGGTTPGQCPGDRSCPSGWYWHSEFQICVPKYPNQGSGNCDNSPFKYWDNNDQCCKNPPSTPSHGVWKAKRAEVKPRSDCPSDLQVCPIAGTNESECIDPVGDLRHCGGCSTLNWGQDCTAIPYVVGVTCLNQKCRVSSCEDGFAAHNNGTAWSCSPSLTSQHY